jgi:hypothetical protein
MSTDEGKTKLSTLKEAFSKKKKIRDKTKQIYVAG